MKCPRLLSVRSQCGLGNRLRALTSARRVAKRCGRQLVVHWPLDPYHCFCPYERLFTTPHFFAHEPFTTAGVWVDQYAVGKTPTRIDPNSPADHIHVVEDNFIWLKGDRGVVWGQFGPRRMKNHELRDEVKAEFDALVPARHVSREVEAFAGQLGAAVGVHIRREDNVWSNRYCTDDLFLAEVDRALDTRADKVLLATDGPESRRAVRDRYGARVVEYPVRSFARGADPEAVEDALVTMLLLARTRLLIRSVSSTFSQCAAWFGNVPTVDVGLREHNY